MMVDVSVTWSSKKWGGERERGEGERERGRGGRERSLVCSLAVALSPSNVLVDILDESAKTSERAATLRQKLICLSESQYTDTRPASPSTGPVTADGWQGSYRGTSSKS